MADIMETSLLQQLIGLLLATNKNQEKIQQTTQSSKGIRRLITLGHKRCLWPSKKYKIKWELHI